MAGICKASIPYAAVRRRAGIGATVGRIECARTVADLRLARRRSRLPRVLHRSRYLDAHASPPTHNAMPARSSRALTAAIGAVVVVVVAAVRLAGLDSLPGEWYGDISTLHEYALAVRNRDFPPALYSLGVGPLHPLIAAAVLPGGGAGYLAYKLLGVGLSLAGLAALHVLARQLHPDRAFAWLAVIVAGTGSWFLALSRLGDQHPLPFLLTVVAMALAVALQRTDERTRIRAVACGVVSGAGLYAYGATFMLPAVTAAVVLAGWWKGRVSRPAALQFVIALVVVVAPLAWAVLMHWADIRAGHFARAAATGPAEIPANVVSGLAAYHVRGDVNVRVNPQALPHLDPLSGVAMLFGIVWWLRAPRRAAGAIVLGAFLAMQLPSFMTAAADVPSAGRTVAAAPFAYLLVAGGLWWGYETASRRASRRVAALSLAAALAAIVAINLHRYFVAYPAGLPWENTEVARPIARHLATLPAGTHAYLVDTGWGPRAVPEIKSVRYSASPGSLVDEIRAVELDCARLAALARPGVLVWRPSLPLPSPALCECAGALRSDVHTSPGGLPLFRSAMLPPRDAPPAACSDETASAFVASGAAAAGAAGRAAAMAPLSGEVTVSTAAGPVRVRHPPLDMGNAADLFDGNETTLMRGARDNPFRFEIAYARPATVASIDLVLGYMPDYGIAVTAIDGAGRRHAIDGRFEGVPGVVPHPRLAFGSPVEDVREIHVTIDDSRPQPAEGAHIHVYELVVR